jgi:superfamily II DNA or RNA helicase
MYIIKALEKVMGYLILSENQQVKLSLTNLSSSNTPSTLDFIVRYKQQFEDLYTLYGSEVQGRKVYIMEINPQVRDFDKLYKAIYNFKRSPEEGKGFKTNGGFLFINSAIPETVKLKLPLQLNCYYISPSDEKIYQLSLGNYLAAFGKEITQLKLNQLAQPIALAAASSSSSVALPSAHQPTQVTTLHAISPAIPNSLATRAPLVASAKPAADEPSSKKRAYEIHQPDHPRTAPLQAEKKPKLSPMESLIAKLPALTPEQQQRAAATKLKLQQEKEAEHIAKKRKLDEFNRIAQSRIAQQETAIAKSTAEQALKEEKRLKKLGKSKQTAAIPHSASDSFAFVDMGATTHAIDEIPLAAPTLQCYTSLPHHAAESRRIGTQNMRAFLARSKQYLDHTNNPHAAASSSMAITPKCIPRAYQADVIEAFCKARERNTQHRANLPIVMPTGTGKSCVISILTSHSNGKHMVLAPWTEVVEGLQDEIKSFCDRNIRIANADNFEPSKKHKKDLATLKKTFESSAKSAIDHKIYHDGKTLVKKEIYNSIVEQNDIIVCSNQFLKASKKFKIFPWKKIDSVIFDEVHHIPAQGNEELFKYLRDEKNVETVGLTATPNASLYELFELDLDGKNNPIESFNIRQAVDKKALAPIQCGLIIFNESGKFKLNSKGEFSATDVEAKLKQESFTKAIAHFVLNKVSPKTQKPFRHMTTLISCAGVDHAKQMKTTLNNAIGVNDFDPTNSLRNRYAENLLNADLKTKTAILAKAKNIKLVAAEQQAKNMTEKLAREIAQATAGVATAIFAPRKSKDEPLTQDDINTDKRIYELGGYTFASVCGKLGEGYSLSRIEHVIPFRMSTSTMLISQLGGRAERLDKNNPNKVAHITQVSTKDDVGKIALYHEEHFTINGKTQFSYGEPPALSDGDIMMQDPALSEITIQGHVAYRYNTEEPEELKQIKMTKQASVERKLSTEQRKAQRVQRKQTKATSLSVSIDELKKIIDKLKELFKTSKAADLEISGDDIAVETAELSKPTVSSTDQPVINIGVSASAPPLLTTSTNKHQQSAASDVLTCSKHDFLISAKKTLANISTVLSPLYHAISTKSTWDNARKATQKAQKDDLAATPEKTIINELFKEAKALTLMILNLRKNNYAYHGEFVESNLNNDIDQQLSDTDQLERSIQQLSDAIQQDSNKIAQAIIDIKSIAKLKKDSKEKLSNEEDEKRVNSQYVAIGKAKLSQIDPDNTMSIFEVFDYINKENLETAHTECKLACEQQKNAPELYQQQKHKHNHNNDIENFYIADNILETFKAKLQLSPNQLTLSNAVNGNNILHLCYLIEEAFTIRRKSLYKKQRQHLRTTLENLVASCPVELFTQKNSDGITPVHLFTAGKTRRTLKFLLINACFDRSIDPNHENIVNLKKSIEQSDVNEEEFYVQCFFHQNWSLQDYDKDSILHCLHRLPTYIIDQILGQHNQLDFSVKNKENKLPIHNLLDNILYGANGKQLQTLEKLLALKVDLGISNQKIYLHIIKHHLLDPNATQFIAKRESFDSSFYLPVDGDAYALTLDKILIEALTLNNFDMLLLQAKPDIFFKVLKEKHISQHVISTVTPLLTKHMLATFENKTLSDSLVMLQKDIHQGQRSFDSVSYHFISHKINEDVKKKMECYTQFCLILTNSKPGDTVSENYSNYLQLITDYASAMEKHQKLFTAKTLTKHSTYTIKPGHSSDSLSLLESPKPAACFNENEDPFNYGYALPDFSYPQAPAAAAASSAAYTAPLESDGEEDLEEDSVSESGEELEQNDELSASEEEEEEAVDVPPPQNNQNSDESDYSSDSNSDDDSDSQKSIYNLSTYLPLLFSGQRPAAAASSASSETAGNDRFNFRQ